MNPLTFVLVHGSWHEGALWGDVVVALEAAGHEAHAPTLAGFGDVPKDVTHADCVASLVDFVVGRDLRDIVLVGHSFGGSVVAVAAPHLDGRLSRLVFHNGFVPEDGNSVMDECPPAFRGLWDAAAQAGEHSVPLAFDVWRDEFIGDVDLDEARRTYALLTPTPRQPSMDKLDMRAFYALDVPRSYLNCTEDLALPPGERWGWHPRMSSRLGLHRLVQMPGSHEVMFSDPGGLARKLVEAGRP